MVSRWDVESFMDSTVELYNAWYITQKELKDIGAIAISVKAQVIEKETRRREEETRRREEEKLQTEKDREE